MPNLFSFLRGNRLCRALFTTVLGCLDQSSLLLMWTPRNLKLSTSPVDENGDVLGAPFPVVHNHHSITGEEGLPLHMPKMLLDIMPSPSTVHYSLYVCVIYGKQNISFGTAVLFSHYEPF